MRESSAVQYTETASVKMIEKHIEYLRGKCVQ